MADIEYEEFCGYFDEIPENTSAAARSYKLVHDVAIDEEISAGRGSTNIPANRTRNTNKVSCETINTVFDFEANNSKRNANKIANNHRSPKRNDLSQKKPKNSNDKKKRRNELKIVTHKKDYDAPLSLAAEFEVALRLTEIQPFITQHHQHPHQPSIFTPLSMNINENAYASDSELCDSGNSTAYSSDDSLLIPGSAESSSSSSFTHLELLEATHRALHKFVARHSDELELDIGDPIYVQKEAEDLWCEGINLRNGNRGIFPSAYVVDNEYNDFDPNVPRVKRERFVLKYMGSVETLYHKGDSVLSQAMRKIRSREHFNYHSCVLEISDEGLKMYDGMKSKRDNVPTLDYFYSLKNISCCGYHPEDSRLMGFITKHPRCERFACHVFQGEDSTRLVTEAIGRAFERFYKKYVETAFPVEDIYLE